MRKKKYYFNDGVDGVVLAKSLKQAIGLLSKIYKIPKMEIRQGVKNSDKENYYVVWFVDVYPTKVKGKSRILYWTE